MSSRVLSAYFDDFRKGKRQREELRLFMEDAIRKEPLRRGHFMGWLDQAQYEHPIPVTEFLLLRKEIEASLDNDEQTRIVPPPGPVKTSPDAETLVAGNEEATLVATRQADPEATEISSGSQPSDMARLHAAATLIGASPEPPASSPESSPARSVSPTQPSNPDPAVEDATVVSGTHASLVDTRPRGTPESAGTATPPRSGRSTSAPFSTSLPIWLWGSLALVVLALGAGYWGLSAWDAHPLVEETVMPPAAPAPTATVETLARAVIGEPTTAPQESRSLEAEPAATAAAEPLPADLSPQQAMALLIDRISAGELLPLEQPGKAQEVMDYLLANHPQATETLEARQLLKDAYLDASKRAQGQGEWDRSQLLLDAAFNVLSATAR
ncbi:hypothetical protein [Ketobacter sp.]|uniref:hypothetical protein n=1 Tax=Ketobacter sp. TaxID=2083498 RepID=UPI000F13B00F|nr:hypothetical protein [Ketobacter sp.]RLU01090.1 MAG: hypothetical protein D9N14_03840 [Ketobacter sp.]